MKSIAASILKPVNVRFVRHRSPFRYPGGKTWFVPMFRNWMATLNHKPDILIEPFTGGGIIGLTALFENLVDKVVMAELDDDVASIWKTVVDGHVDSLVKKILEFNLTYESLVREIMKPDTDITDKAFKTILKNRTYYGGILAKGAGLPKDNRGILSRWYPDTLAKRFSDLKTISDRISFFHGDGLNIMREYSKYDSVVFFIDPPYTIGGKKAGRRLYKHHSLDHDDLFSICETLHGKFLMTYDDVDEVREMATHHGFQTRKIHMKTNHHSNVEELIIGGDLSWIC